MKSFTNTRRRFGVLVLALALLSSSLLVLERTLPARWVLPLLYQFYNWQAGVHDTQIPIATTGEALSAFEGGPDDSPHPPVLLLHGFGDSKVSFVQAARYLTPAFHVLLPEFPGFGDQPHLPGRSHSIRAQVERLHALVTTRNWAKVYLVGNSMGGHIAAAFTLRYPEKVAGLIAISSAGLLVDDPIPYRPSEKPIATEADFDAYMDLLFFKKPWIPHAFKVDFIQKAAQRFEGLQAIRKEIREGEDYLLNERLSNITAPTLILWGRVDGVVRVAHAPVWKEKIPHAELKIFEDAGHSLQYEYPERTGTLLRAQLEQWSQGAEK